MTGLYVQKLKKIMVHVHLFSKKKFYRGLFQSDAGWEEYYDYIFPDETAAQPNLKLLAMAKKWKEKQAETEEVEEKENIDADSDSDKDSDSEDEVMSES